MQEAGWRLLPEDTEAVSAMLWAQRLPPAIPHVGITAHTRSKELCCAAAQSNHPYVDSL